LRRTIPVSALPAGIGRPRKSLTLGTIVGPIAAPH